MNVPFVPLVKEYRGSTHDLTHFGYIVIVDENSNVVYSAGDPEAVVFYRSASKPVQALPVIAHGLDKKFGLTDEETVIFAGSHLGEKYHVNALESIMRKADLSEDMLCMKPTAPGYGPENEERIRHGLPLRKIYHNCSGKHTALMLVQRELGGEVRDYWKMGAPVQKEVEETILKMSEETHVELGVDGCGVPVFAVPIKGIATAFKNLAVPEKIKDDRLQQAAASYVPRIHRYPDMMRGTGYICSLLNYDENIVAKGGANSVYGFGLKKEKLGVAFKFIDGTEHNWPLIVMEVLKGLGCLSEETRQRLDNMHPYFLYNDNQTLVGERKPCFEVKI